MSIDPLPPLLLKGDCLVELARIPDDSVDSIVTDPPYGIDFMGKDWDKAVKLAAGMIGQIATGGKSDRGPLPKGGTHSQGYKNHDGLAFEIWVTRWAAECLRILKPGGHMLAFGGSRTWHRLAAGIEDAGFEIRDSIAWLYGSGFPKSMDVSKAIDKAAGATREKVRKTGAASAYSANAGNDRPWMQKAREEGFIEVDGDAPATDAAREWGGWGTALKPAFEPIVVARKPLGERTVAANVLAHGTGALNIDASRIAGAKPDTTRGGHIEKHNVSDSHPDAKNLGRLKPQGRILDDGAGRWPANVVLDESQAAALDEQSGTTKSLRSVRVKPGGVIGNGETHGRMVASRENVGGFDDSGGASRFFYVAKAPKSERPVYWRPSCNCETVLSEWSEISVCANCGAPARRESHATVKPLALMRWLIRLVTPPEGCVVDPFAGSGTTLEAAYLEGFESIGVELTPEYWPLIEARIERVTS